MKTNEEIVNKIREMMLDEDEKIKDLTRTLNQLEGRDEIEKTNKAERQWFRHFGAWAALEYIEKFATED